MNLLTPIELNSNLAMSLPHATVRTTTPVTTGHKAAIFAVFYCPSKIINAGLIRVKSFMVGCIGHPSGWLVPVAGCSNPVQPATQRLLPKSGGYIPNTGETAMRYLTQNLTFSVSQKSLSRFNVFTPTGRSLAKKYPFKQL